MTDISAILLVIGFIAGNVVLRLPVRLWLKPTNSLTPAEFKIQFPQKRWVLYVYQFLPYGWLLIYAFGIFPGVFRGFGVGSIQLYFVAYMIFGGFSLFDSVLEIISEVSPIRGKRQGGLKLHELVYTPSIRRFGWLHLSFVVGVAVLSWIILLIFVR